MASLNTPPTLSVNTTLRKITNAAADTTAGPPADARDNFAVVAERQLFGQMQHALPTPPHSISPALKPHGLKAQLAQLRGNDAYQSVDTTPGKMEFVKTEHVDTDMDLRDDSSAIDYNAVNYHNHASHHKDPVRVKIEAEDNNSSSTITSALLAHHYLPDILIHQGPLALTHIMGCLTTTVPGFAALSPVKARRLVVAALDEGVTGPDSKDVHEFEKVGWGKWDIRRRRRGRGNAGSRRRSSSPADHIGSPYARPVAIPVGVDHKASRRSGRTHDSRMSSISSIGFSYSSNGECDADRMSLDGTERLTGMTAYSNNANSRLTAKDRIKHHVRYADDDFGMEDIYMNDDPDDATDEEDWAAIGAEALRRGSYPYIDGTRATDARGKSLLPALVSAQSMPVAITRTITTTTAIEREADATTQERAAIEALLSLGR